MRFCAHAATLFVQCMGLAMLLLAIGGSGARSAEFTDAAGRRVAVPDRVGRVMAADRTAEVLVLVLTPDKLAGLGREPRRGGLPPRFTRVPGVRWGPAGGPAERGAGARELA